MPRRKPQDTDDMPGIPPGIKLLNVPPPTLADGKPNRDYYTAKMVNLNAIQEYYMAATGAGCANYHQTLKGIELHANLAGVDLKDILDSRTAEKRFEDAIEKLLGAGGQTPLELAEEELAAVLKAEQDVVTLCQQMCEQAQMDINEAGIEAKTRSAEWEARQARGKRWWRLIREIVNLRERTRQKRPVRRMYNGSADAWEATYPLRLAAYVYRSDLTSASATPAESVFKLAWHHANMAFETWKARYGVKFYAKGMPGDAAKWPHIYHDKGGAVKGSFHCEGIIIVCPPRHGKSMFGTGWMVSEYVDDPRTQGFLLHAMQPHAAKNFRHIKAAFQDDNAIGRRCAAVFPHLRLSARDDTKDTMRLDLSEPTRDPQLTAVGGKTGVGGSNTNIQWWDDPVDPKEREQPNERESTKRRLQHQVRRRMQGKRPFLLVTATLWHLDDAVNCMIEDAKRSEIKFSWCIMRCGGPPQFEAIWPEQIGPRVLRNIYAEMKSPGDYRAQYMCDPRPDETRIIKKLKLYDATDENEAHKVFMRTAEMHVSLDPNATSKEKAKRYTDKSALVYAALGETLVSHEENGVRYNAAKRIIRIVDTRLYYASPTEAIGAVADFSLSHRVDKIHVERVGFSGAIVESLRTNFNLSASQVIDHPVRSMSKRDRLKAVAPMLDESLAEMGLGSAVVEFPGIRLEDGSLQIRPDTKWLWDEILDFGAAKTDNGVDAVTQLCKGLQERVDVSGGDVTTAIRVAAVQYTPEQVRRRVLSRMYERAGQPQQTGGDEHGAMREESAFFDRGDTARSQEVEDLAWANGWEQF